MSDQHQQHLDNPFGVQVEVRAGLQADSFLSPSKLAFPDRGIDMHVEEDADQAFPLDLLSPDQIQQRVMDSDTE